MCDVLVAMPDVTGTGKIVFGKNSDRPVDDCQVLHYSPRRQPGDRKVQCSYLEVPDAENALATLGCRPYWCWGYETAINEAGVVGGNAAVFTRDLQAAKEQPGLTGMDLLRLGLERGQSAQEAVQVMAELLEQYGQWGSAVPGKTHGEGSYDNSFLLCDGKEAWVLETSGRRWVAEKVLTGIRCISNELTIRTEWTQASPDLREHAQNHGWWQAGRDRFDFALAYSDHEHYPRQVSHLRRMRSQQLLRDRAGALDATAMMNILRDHYEDTFLGGPEFHPFLPDFHTLCMHVSPAGFTWGNTATSVVVEIDPEDKNPPPVWVCYLTPCSSVYTAYYLGSELPDTVTATGRTGLKIGPASEAPLDQFRESSLWWRFRQLVDAVQQDPLERWKKVRSIFDPMERRRVKEVETLLHLPESSRVPAFDALIREEVNELTHALDLLADEW